MTLARVRSGALVGIEGLPVDVEVGIGSGLPAFNIVGLPDAAVQEARERVCAAIRNAGFEFPLRRIIVNLAPADVRKEGDQGVSEGTGYGMLLAVAAGDRDAFQRIWGWTRANLMVRDDALLAWRWEPDKRPAVADMNDATDGDILVAWALVEAGEGWTDEGYRLAARRIAVDIARRTVLFRSEGLPLLLPAMSGFSAEDRPDGPVVNLSYWVFPAFPRLAAVAPEFDWDRLVAAGRDLVLRARFGEAKLPTEWISMRGGQPQPATGFPPHFSYNAVRVPLYLAMAGIGERRAYEPFLALWAEPDPAGLPIIDTATGAVAGRMSEPGYAAIPALAACAVDGTPMPAGIQEPATTDNYYPATLHLLALTAANMRYRPCLGR